MPIQRKFCPTCNKRAILSATNNIAGQLFETYSCGHTSVSRQFKSADFEYFQSQDGKKLYLFQCIGAEFALQSNCRMLIADEMGLGKTPQSLAPIAAEPKELSPFLIICKATPMIQWCRETARWLGDMYSPQIIASENQFILPGFKAFVISYDMLWRFKDIPGLIKRLGIKYIILDEVQHIKNTGSKRTNGVRAACSQVEHIGALSGAPIENDPIEFFPILNILYPARFLSESSFSMKWINSYWNGYKNKSMGMKDIAAWQSYTKDFIIRRTRSEVLPDLPAISREYRFSELTGSIEDAYNDTMTQFTSYYDANQTNLDYSCILAYMVKMRHLVGVAKINPTIDFVTDFIEETGRKIILFLHHRDVAGVIMQRLGELATADKDKWGQGILQIASETKDRQGVIDSFREQNYRVLVASTLAAGEALNIQFCSDAIMMERQWNPSKEEQAEGRIVRIGQSASKLTCTYMQVINTIDDTLGQLVEKKRSMKANVLDGKDIDWNESSLIKELAEILAQRRSI